MINAVASTSQGKAYLNIPTTSSSTDCATADLAAQADTTQHLLDLQNGVLGSAMAKEHWQADGSSVLCSYPLCTTNFGPVNTYSYFALRPRRHHCRKCGLIFCSSHTMQRAPLIHLDLAGKRIVSQERICDTCLPTAELSTPSRSRRSSSCSADSRSTFPSERLDTPNDDYMVMTRSSSRANLDVAETSDLAPVESWMGPSGILSLYPLAVNPSHATERLVPALAAGPLFSPSIAARRNAMEKEMERTSLRQRRLGSDKEAWIPGAWGYSRKDFDPTYVDTDVEGDQATEGGLVVDGPIRFRSQAKRPSLEVEY